MKTKGPIEPRTSKSLRRQIESIKRSKIVGKKVVSLNEFRDLQKNVDNRTILVVDDDEIMRNAIKRILEAEGYQIITASEGLELSKLLETTQLDLILLDVNLPWVNGLELTRLIKNHHSLKTVPLVLISANKTPEDIQRGFDAGCNDYVTKPFEVDAILKVIHQHLEAAASLKLTP